MTVFNDGTFYYTFNNDKVILGNQNNYINCPNALFKANSESDILTISSTAKYNSKTYVIKETMVNSFCCKSYKKVFIPKTYEVIGFASFAYCKKLKEVEFEKGSNLLSINRRAFDNCISLTKMIIPSSVSLIEKDAFKSTNMKLVYYCGKQNFADATIFTGVKGNIRIYTLRGVYMSSLFGQKQVIQSKECICKKFASCSSRNRIPKNLIIILIILTK